MSEKPIGYLHINGAFHAVMPAAEPNMAQIEAAAFLRGRQAGLNLAKHTPSCVNQTAELHEITVQLERVAICCEKGVSEPEDAVHMRAAIEALRAPKARLLTDELHAKAQKMAYSGWTEVGINVSSLQVVLREVLAGIGVRHE